MTMLASAIDVFGFADMLALRRVTFNGVTLGDNLDDREFEDKI